MNSCSHLHQKLASAGLALLIGLGISACGGGAQKKSSTTTTSTTTSSSIATTSVKPKPKAKPKLVEAVRVDKPGGIFQSALAASVGDIVEFRTVIAPRGQGKTVQLKITNQAGRISVNATAHKHSSTATITSAAHQPIVLSAIHYTCEAPPTATFCPAQNVVTNSSGYQLQFPIRRATPILVLAKVALSTTPPAKKLRPTTSAVVPAYKVTETVRAVSPKSTATVKPAPSSPVAAGDVVMFETHAGGKLSGAPQPVTVTIPQGPAKTLTITASVPGGAPSHATLTAASGTRIALVEPHFTCFLPPFPTFCPASKVQLTKKTYTLVFEATPNNSPIVVVARAQQA